MRRTLTLTLLLSLCLLAATGAAAQAGLPRQSRSNPVPV
jgi:hypothetical protein